MNAEMEEFIIRQADVGEIDTIRWLAEKIWPQTYRDILTQPQIEYMMDLFYSRASLMNQFAKDTFLLLFAGEAPEGFASYAPSAEPGIYKLNKIYVSPDMQGHGLGSALICHIKSRLQATNATALQLNVNRDNKARFFYEKLGFKIIRSEDIHIGHNFWMNDYVMETGLEI